MKKITIKFLLVIMVFLSTSFTEPIHESKYDKDIAEITSYLERAESNLQEAKEEVSDTLIIKN